MTARIEIPSALQKFANNQMDVEVEGHNVQETLENLLKQHSQLRDHLYDEKGRIRSFINIYLNDEDIRYTDNLDTKVKAGDVIQIVPSIAGGQQ
ncbi:MAG: MoaD/ThiS family protein [Deltaproteobacteria bacterium]|nr:MoaD/ThiS family protein [Deltaproteobacteria bacterium]